MISRRVQVGSPALEKRTNFYNIKMTWEAASAKINAEGNLLKY
jgi:hypothetical protein